MRTEKSFHAWTLSIFTSQNEKYHSWSDNLLGDANNNSVRTGVIFWVLGKYFYSQSIR